MKNEKEIIKMFETLKSYKISEVEIEKTKSKLKFLGNAQIPLNLMMFYLKGNFNGEMNISIKDLAMLIGLVLYIAITLDVIPDFISNIGYSDDIWLIYYVFEKIKK